MTKDWQERLLPKPTKWGRHESKYYPVWLKYEGICKCDDGFLCEHRYEFMIKTISQLLQDQLDEVVELIDDSYIEPNLAYPREIEFYNEALLELKRDILDQLKQKLEHKV